MEISSQNFSKNGWELIKKYREDNVYRTLVRCEKCGYEKVVNYYNFIDTKRSPHICTKCKNEQWANSETGKVYGTVKILEFDHIGDQDKYGHVPVYFKTECTICNKTSIRLFNKSQWESTNGCRRCTATFNNSSLNSIFKVYQDGSKSRNIEWCLTNDQFLELIYQDCYYCGNPPEVRNRDKSTDKEMVNGIDRIDSSKGYVFDNCVPCCTMCNYMKQSYTIDNFLDQVKKIYQHRLEKEGSTTIERQ